MSHLLSLRDIDADDVHQLIASAEDIKASPMKYADALKGATLLMIFEKPSLRTRLSFDVGIKELGGFSVIIDTGNTPLGAKESIEDTAKVCGRYVDCIMARLFKQEDLIKLASYSGVPVINGLTNDYHPVQILSDLLSIKEKKGTLEGLKLCFLGDGNNNVTNSLLLGCSLMGIDIAVGCPEEASPNPAIVEEAKKRGNSEVTITSNAQEAIKDADIVYTDSWMSYHIKPEEKDDRVMMFNPYQVNAKLCTLAKKDFIFMNCLPAQRGYEQTAEIIDGAHSIVFDQAENRLHMQKAILLALLKNS